MKTVKIVTAFTFTDNSYKQHEFKEGIYELPDEVADHWYVRVHSDNPPPSGPPVGTVEYALVEAKKKEREKIINAAVEVAAAETVKAASEAAKRERLKEVKS